ncbi:hypothetical protein [Carboxylicivirga sp. M1479]|uniref:hypothetical protein n=1 Tax=Carboxylicivirga sp. M1479 TaxID=2594476 RepID=UPI00117895FC|nr:hypothetical protein [Carboxylicivirga sp. M1479]TRX71895.1 hypothetical protein FNN09_04545 [Carboxylicivirga sp. M1479]
MKKVTFLSLLVSLSLFLACQEDTFMEDSEMAYLPPTELEYLEVLEARDGQRVITFPPAVNTGGLIPYFELVRITNAEGAELGEEHLKFVSIANPENDTITVNDEGDRVPIVKYKDAGTITIEGDNPFTFGDYYFDIKVITSPDDAVNKRETTFEKGFHLKVGPALVTALNYRPVMQNLLLDGSKQTTAPYVSQGSNPDIRYELGTHSDIFTIDAATGIIKLVAGVTPAEDTYYPQINVISNISEEVVSYQGESTIAIVVSEEPAELELQTINLFYATLEAPSPVYGFQKFITQQGAISESATWIAGAPCNLAGDDRLESAASAKSIMTNIVVSKKSQPHTSWAVINPQNLANYNQGYELTATFWTKNQYVEYMTDKEGRTPTNLEIYVSTDFTNDVEAATWTQVNDVLKCEINNSGNTFIGTPYPGDQKGDNPDGLKDLTRNADSKWVKNVLDLEAYKNEKNLTVAFKFASYFEGEIVGATGRGGRYYISDVRFDAKEQAQE